jgi:hypothetical protein
MAEYTPAQLRAIKAAAVPMYEALREAKAYLPMLKYMVRDEELLSLLKMCSAALALAETVQPEPEPTREQDEDWSVGKFTPVCINCKSPCKTVRPKGYAGAGLCLGCRTERGIVG